jgi:predicted dehydrogenase
MKQIVQNLKQSILKIENVPTPICKAGGVLVRTYFSTISVGTEKMKLKNADMNYLEMAKAKPEQVKQVFNTLSQLGPIATYRKVMNKLDSLSPLGYSISGEVVEIGEGVTEFKLGDLVACGGAGFANHAEINYVPKNLCVKIPDGVDIKDASLTTIASIAMQGFRQTDSQIGENIAIIGLGLIGQILVQIIQASGCRAIGFDIDPARCKMAEDQGAFFTAIADTSDFEGKILSMTDGVGCDSVIITTGTESNMPILLAGKIVRDRARIVDIGITKMDLPWDIYYHKELDFKFSRSYGPGRYDPQYEDKGVDYPIGYVRWTEERNMQSVLQLLKSKKICFKPLITHTYDFSDILTAYTMIKREKESCLGVIIKYDSECDFSKMRITLEKEGNENKKIILGGIGAGNYASTMLYPFLRNKPEIEFAGLATATGINVKDKAKKFNFNYATTNYKDIINDKKINTVLIATRHNQHAELVVDAMNAMKHVYVEKPLALSEQELKDIIKAQKISKKVLMVGYNRRYAPSIQYLKKLLNPGNRYSIYYQVNAGFIPKNNWYQEPEQGGRIIGEVCHFVDTIQYLLDTDPVSVFTHCTETEDMPDQDNCFINLKFNNGSTAVISYQSDGDKRYPKEKIFITGFRTNIEFNNFKEIKYFNNGHLKIKKFINFDKGQKNEMKAFINAIADHNFKVPFESYLLNSLTTILALKSIRTGNVYSVKLNQLVTE